MTPYRIFVEKREPYRVEAESLRNELNSNLGLHIQDLRLLCVYDLFGFTPELLDILLLLFHIGIIGNILRKLFALLWSQF